MPDSEEKNENRCKQWLIRELLKDLKGPKDFLNLMQELKEAFVPKVGDAFKEVSLNREAPKISIFTDPKISSILWGKQKNEPLRRVADKVVEMYAKGMGLREIRSNLEERQREAVSVESILSIIKSVADKLKKWQNEPLEKIYPILYIDKVPIRIIENNQCINKTVYLAIGINVEGKKEVLDLWIIKKEDQIFWSSVLKGFKSRGVEAILVACVYELEGFQESLKEAFPNAITQLCMVQMVRNSLKYIYYKDRQAVADELKKVYEVPTADVALQALSDFSKKWDNKYPAISALWDRHWIDIIELLTYPDYSRQALYNPYVIDSINRKIVKIIQLKRFFLSDEIAQEFLFLILKNAQKERMKPIKEWPLVLDQFTRKCGIISY